MSDHIETVPELIDRLRGLWASVEDCKFDMMEMPHSEEVIEEIRKIETAFEQGINALRRIR